MSRPNHHHRTANQTLSSQPTAMPPVLPTSALKSESMPSESLKSEPLNPIRAVRETMEALVIALVLAFFFKGFAAEAYVIPTGSMAPTLMGRHKDLQCAQCGYHFQISASEESSDGADIPTRSRPLTTIMAGTCPQCRYTNYVGPEPLGGKKHQSYSGDRIFVNKSQFDFRSPTRWHVTVFRYPALPQINYIKRLVGEENESLRLKHGDVFVKKNGEQDYTIQRKPLSALLAMLRPVDDNNFVMPALHQLGWPTRWFDDAGHWKRSEDYKSYSIDAAATNSDIHWLRFRNVIASSDDWESLSQKKMPDSSPYNMQLVSDFLGYNSGVTDANVFEIKSHISIRDANRTDVPASSAAYDTPVQKEYFCRANASRMGLNWVGDLALSCRVQIDATQDSEPEAGELWLQLVKGGTRFVCRIDLSSGLAELSIPDLHDEKDQPLVLGSAQTSLRMGQTVDLMFCNIDEELRLIVDGREIDFGLDNRYDRLCGPGGLLPRDRSPSEADLTPASVGARHASMTVSNLKIQRDIYYIASTRPTESLCDLEVPPFSLRDVSESTIHRVFSTPALWTRFGKTRTKTFELGKDEFLMLGDNSAQSKDGRLWTVDGIPHYVKREMLIGEALFVYWPHGITIPGTRLPWIPNLGKMRIID